MPQPKKKTSHQKQAQRRAHWKLEETLTATCSNCGSARLSHYACPGCGYYDGRPARRRDWLVNND